MPRAALPRSHVLGRRFGEGGGSTISQRWLRGPDETAIQVTSAFYSFLAVPHSLGFAGLNIRMRRQPTQRLWRCGIIGKHLAATSEDRSLEHLCGAAARQSPRYGLRSQVVNNPVPGTQINRVNLLLPADGVE